MRHPTALAIMGLQLGYLLGGSILIETVFSWPGTGFLLNSAIFPARPALAARHDPGARHVLRCLELDRGRHADGARSADSESVTMVAIAAPPIPDRRGRPAAAIGPACFQRFLRDRVAVIAATVIGLIVAGAVFCAVDSAGRSL